MMKITEIIQFVIDDVDGDVLVVDVVLVKHVDINMLDEMNR